MTSGAIEKGQKEREEGEGGGFFVTPNTPPSFLHVLGGYLLVCFCDINSEILAERGQMWRYLILLLMKRSALFHILDNTCCLHFLTLFVFITHRVEFITKQHGTLLENCKKIRGY